jgi:hypothetical protein
MLLAGIGLKRDLPGREASDTGHSPDCLGRAVMDRPAGYAKQAELNRNPPEKGKRDSQPTIGGLIQKASA